MVVTIIKKNGSKEKFYYRKLYKSIERAILAGGLSRDEALNLYNEVMSQLAHDNVILSKKISDIVEKTMIEKILENPKWEEPAKRYALARIYNDVFGKGNWWEFNSIDLTFTFNAIKVLEARYLLRNPETSRYLETPYMLHKRVAKFLAKVEERYGKGEGEIKQIENEFLRLLNTHRFKPNTPTLMNADTKLGILSACFVVPVRDSITTPRGDGIYDALRAQAIIFQQGGGTGFDFSELRPRNDAVSSTAGVSSGPISFMRLFDVNTDVIKQGGKRRGANMGVMHVWHPDIMDFVKAKTGALKDANLQNFNISVGVYDSFMKALENGEKWPLVNPRKTDLLGLKDSRYYAIVEARHSIREDWVKDILAKELEEKGSVPYEDSLLITMEEALSIAESKGAIVDWVDPSKIFKEIYTSAWEGGDPGMLFIDEINRRHPTWYLGKINATNPCGEEPLLEWENCNLGSINLEKYVYEDEKDVPHIDWEGLAKDVMVAVRFLDNVIDANRHPLPQITGANLKTRKVGLGVMGWARMLIRLRIPYDSQDAVKLAWIVGEWITYYSYKESMLLAKEKGTFPAWNPDLYRFVWRTKKHDNPEDLLSIAGLPVKGEGIAGRLLRERGKVDWDKLEEEIKGTGLRNAALLSIAPTGTISILSGASSSIEPLFALAFMRFVSVGQFIEVDSLFLKDLAKYELDDPELILEIAQTGSIAGNKYLPRTLRKVYKVAHDIDPEWHLLHQAAWQAWVDAGVSKTVNLRQDEPPETVRRVYLLAWKLGVKGITIYRDRSKSTQVIEFGVKKEPQPDKVSKEKQVVERTVPEEPKPALIIEAESKSEETAIENVEVTSEPSGSETRETAGKAKVRLGRGKVSKIIEVVTASEDYAGGCLTCDA
ncbi:MAG: adenosylcobalamin-dependent ribonucleoside-diphosphate reductase [Desulfurococcales archaeon]|nr:adenosylcobalamin-dependent ribonucleoside-diphosphate reductase [Desulfurococcales archaeon]